MGTKEKTPNEKAALIERMHAMGIPTPIQPINPAQMWNVNAPPEKLAILEQIKSGAKKVEFDSILEKASPDKGFKALPVPSSAKRKNPNTPPTASPPLSEATIPNDSNSAEAKRIESMLYGDIPTSTPANVGDINFDSYIAKLPVNSVEAKMNALKQRNGIIQTTQPKPVSFPTQTSVGLSEEDLKKKIISIASQVSKQMIKKVILEYVKDGKDIIVESKKIKKAEVVGKNIVKIGGRMFKLIPVKDKDGNII